MGLIRCSFFLPFSFLCFEASSNDALLRNRLIRQDFSFSYYHLLLSLLLKLHTEITYLWFSSPLFLHFLYFRKFRSSAARFFLVLLFIVLPLFILSFTETTYLLFFSLFEIPNIVKVSKQVDAEWFFSVYPFFYLSIYCVSCPGIYIYDTLRHLTSPFHFFHFPRFRTATKLRNRLIRQDFH